MRFKVRGRLCLDIFVIITILTITTPPAEYLLTLGRETDHESLFSRNSKSAKGTTKEHHPPCYQWSEHSFQGALWWEGHSTGEQIRETSWKMRHPSFNRLARLIEIQPSELIRVKLSFAAKRNHKFPSVACLASPSTSLYLHQLYNGDPVPFPGYL